MPKNNDEIINLARTRYVEAIAADKDEREHVDKDTRFAVNHEGCQWPDDVRAAREGSIPPRPCLVNNKIPEKIDQVEGEFRQMEPSVKVRPVDSLADPKIAEIIGGLIRHIHYDSTASDAHNHSHTSVLYGGRGAWRVDVEDDEDDPFIRCIKINRIKDILSVVWDPQAKKKDKSDSRFFFITEQMALDEFKAEYPDIDPSSWPADDKSLQSWRTEKTITKCEYWWKEKQDKKFYRIKRPSDQSGQQPETTVDQEDIIKLLPDFDEADIKETLKNKKPDEKIMLGQIAIVDEKTASVPKVKWGIMIYDRFVDGPHDDWPSKYIPIIVESGKEVVIGGQTLTRGMTRFAKGPQEMYNYWSTASTEQVALAPKSPYLATAKMIGPYQAQWDTMHSNNYPYLLYDHDPQAPGGRPLRENPPQMSPGYANELNRQEHDIMSAMGIYNASLGDDGQEKSGRAIIARQRQGSIGSYTFTDNYKSSLIYETKILIDLIPFIYDTERVVRIVGEDGTEKAVPINAVPNGQAMKQAGEISDELISQREAVTQYINDMTVGKYDVIADVGPSYSTQRQEAAAILMDLVKILPPQIAMSIADLLVANIDTKGGNEIVKRLRKMIPQEIRGKEPGEEEPAQKPPDPAVIMKNMELMLKQQDSLIRMQEESRKEFEARVNAIKSLALAEAAERGQQLQGLTSFMEQIRAHVETQAKFNQQPAQGPAQPSSGTPPNVAPQTISGGTPQ